MIKEYKILWEGDLNSLADLVNKAIADGWQPQGGVTSYQTHCRDGYGNTNIDVYFTQAVTKDYPK